MIQFEAMTPEKLKAEQQKSSIVYLPVGCMEWHGPHLGMGVDTLHANAVAKGTAEITGGVVFPPLFVGTETQRSDENVQALGFEAGTQIVGMDFPQNSYRSMYWPPQLFRQMLDWQVGALQAMGYGLVVLVNGHAATIQTQILSEIVAAHSQSGKSVCLVTAFLPNSEVLLGHATLTETALMCYICPEMVQLDALAPLPNPLDSRVYGIADAGGCKPPDYTVAGDPRRADAPQGAAILQKEIARCAAMVQAEQEKLR